MKVKHIFVDLFCGAGGTSSGIYKARISGHGIAEVVYCINHDANAIRSHGANFKKTIHATEDIRHAAMQPITDAINKRKKQLEARGYKVYVHVWASLECTNFSRAKGGMSREADSRTLAEHLFRYVISLRPDYVWIENVSEFLEWGPLKVKELESDKKNDIFYPHCPLNIIKDKKKKKKIISFDPVMIPIKERLCEFYNAWLEDMKRCGYDYEYRMLNSADFGEHTSRNRYFGQFARHGLPISWPEPTHAKKPERIFGKRLNKWKAVKECLDFSIEGESIFTRKKALSEKTLQRIYAGLIKYVAGGKEAFIQKYNSNNQKTGINSGADIDKPCPTVTTQVRMSLVQTQFISKYYSGNPYDKNKSVEEPAGTITTIDHHALVQAFMTKYHKTGKGIFSMNDVCSTLTTKDRLGLAQIKYLVNYNHSSQTNSINDPAPTITTKDRLAYLNVHYWIDKHYSGDANHQSIDQPAGSIMSNDKHNLMKVEHYIANTYSGDGQLNSIEDPAGSITTVPKINLVKYWIMDTQFNNVGQSVNESGPVITANRKHHYLMNPAWGGHTGDINNPCCTIVARQDKAPLYFIAVEKVGPVAIGVYENDSPTMILIKEFMALYGIVDIKMRMLEILELLKIQGFDEGYELIGTKTEKKKFIGNSVTPRVVKYLIEAMHDSVCDQLRMAA